MPWSRLGSSKLRVAPTMEWRESAFLRRTEIKKAIILTYEQIRFATTLTYKTKVTKKKTDDKNT